MNRQQLSIAFWACMTALPLTSGLVLAADTSGDDQLQELVVTAQRREQSVLTVPLSVQATSGEQLNNLGVQDLTDLRLSTPGLITATDSGFTQIFIRGIGNAIYIGADPSVAYFVDDVPRIYGSMADNLVDVERTEVLKGAQGGLYGRNATGGVVNVITHQPSTESLKADFRISYGEKDTFKSSGYLNIPLINDKLAVSFSVDRESHDAYVKNTAVAAPLTAAMFPTGSPFGSPAQTAAFLNPGYTAPKLNDQDFWSANGKLLFTPTENLKITLASDWYNKQDDNGRGIVTVNPTLTQSLVTGLFNSVGIFPAFPAGLTQGATGKYTANLGVNSYLNTKETGESVTVDWNLPGVDLVSISAYREQNTNIEVDTGSTSIVTVPITVVYDKHYFYQELRGLSTFEGPVHLLGGATYLSNHLDGQTDAYLLTPLLPVGTTKVEDSVKNWSAYLQAAYDFTDKITLTASGRYVHEDNHALFTVPVVSASDSTEKKFIPSATLSYALDDGTAYVRWARGFKTGGIDLATAPIFYPKPSDGSIFGPETVDTYEIGYRQAILNRQVQVTSAIFYNDYRNLQVGAHSTDPAIATAVVNAKSARTYGVEAGVNWQATNSVSLGLNAGYLNAKYKDFKLEDSTVLEPFDLSNERMINSPTLQLALTANLNHRLTDDLRLVGTLLESHTSSVLYQYSSVPGVIPNLEVPGFWLTNARIGVKTTNDRYGLYLIADNLFNQVYYVNGDASVFGNGNVYGNPRIIRGEFTAKF